MLAREVNAYLIGGNFRWLGEGGLGLPLAHGIRWGMLQAEVFPEAALH